MGDRNKRCPKLAGFCQIRLFEDCLSRKKRVFAFLFMGGKCKKLELTELWLPAARFLMDFTPFSGGCKGRLYQLQYRDRLGQRDLERLAA